jgi:hypothetical protein
MNYAKVSGKNVIITLPVDTLVTAFNHYPDKYSDEIRVRYRKQFAHGFAELINEHSLSSESGLTVFQEWIDSIFEEMIESDARYIKYPKDED